MRYVWRFQKGDVVRCVDNGTQKGPRGAALEVGKCYFVTETLTVSGWNEHLRLARTLDRYDLVALHGFNVDRFELVARNVRLKAAK